jgi:LacI family transcriptional regulator
MSPDRHPRTPVTAAMVAERAGTSVATVSLVVNGKARGRVSAANQARVRAAIDELGYVVNRSASALAGGSSDLVALFAPDLANPYHGRVVHGVQEELGARFQLLLGAASVGGQPTGHDVRRVAALQPAGVLVCAPDESFPREAPHDAPLVVMDAPGLDAGEHVINYDLRPAVRALVHHLADLGHRRVAYLGGRTPAATFGLRLRMLLDEAGAREVEVLHDPAAASPPEVQDAQAAFLRAWPAWRDAGVTAVVAAADAIAYGVLAGARDLGLRVPEDLAVAGFDDLPSSAVTGPALTSIALDGNALGRAGARRLLDLIGGGSPDGDAAPGTVAARLVVRASTAGAA